MQKKGENFRKFSKNKKTPKISTKRQNEEEKRENEKEIKKKRNSGRRRRKREKRKIRIDTERINESK